MQGSGLPVTRPEAMADVPGVCEVPLTRAVVQYRDTQDRSGHPPRAGDLGLALVLDGRSPSRVSAIDLGSGVPRILDLSTELVVLDWVYQPTLAHLESLLAAGTDGGPSDDPAVQSYCARIAGHVMERAGYGPLVRPTLLRMGFRDVARDLDPHEGSAVRILMAPGRVARVFLDPDLVRLVVRTGSSGRDAALELALAEAFPTFELRRTLPSVPEGTISYLVLLTVPASLSELRAVLARVRRGIGRVIARFEPERFRTLEGHLEAFGGRDSLERLRIRDARGGSEPVGRGAPSADLVH